jgi:hypothetical protein
MKNLSLLLFFIFLSSCSTGSITGKTSLGAIESPWWFATVDKRDIRDYYDKLSTSRLCIKWEASYPGTKLSSTIRGQISDSLERRGENGLYCSNPSSDSTRISEMKMEKKMEKKMQCTARRTEWRALCSSGDYLRVNGVSCYGTWYDTLHC